MSAAAPAAPELSVVVPAFDEADHIAANLERLLACLEASPRTFEVIVVDDGSRDGTAAAAEAIHHAALRVIRREKNRGKGRALEHGVLAARGAFIVLLDADLEIPPEEIDPLLTRLEADDVDLALGTKYGAAQDDAWPLYRRVLSRLYQGVTALLFRLPLRDTQTGLKAIRAPVARRLVPHLRCRRFAWDLEFVLLALETGHGFVSVPVRLEPAARASRVGWRGALLAAVDTVRIFVRHRWLGHYARAHTPRDTRRTRRTQLLVSGDDLGLSEDVNDGLVAGLEAGGLCSVSVLACGDAARAGLDALTSRAPGADVGLHLDLLRGRSLLRYAALSVLGRATQPGVELTRQLDALGAHRTRLTHVDAHRHAWCLPWTRRRALAAVRAARIPAVRSLSPCGPVFDRGLVEGAKRLVLRGLATFSAGQERLHGLAAPDGYVDVAEARRWVRAGRLPAWVRGRTLEVIAHPALGAGAVPAGESGTLDRASDAQAILDPPLAEALAQLGADVLSFDALRAPRPNPERSPT
ncbi:MAG: glycosyltransferase [Planctomycetota bacterium]|nr:glycosyltransferase [Planctomycetota bacterium]